MTDIAVPKLNNNDVHYLLVEWLVADGAEVAEGDPVLVLETSKATQDLPAPAAGHVLRRVEAGGEYEVGAVLGKLCADAAEFAAAKRLVAAAPEAAAGEPVITAPATALAEQLGVPLDRLKALGVRVVRRKDVANLAGSSETDSLSTVEKARPEGSVALSRHQRGVADVVARSHATIPTGFTAVAVDAAAAVTFARESSKRLRAMIGLPELVVAAVAGLFPRFPVFFATTGDDLTTRPATVPHIGVTVDVGTGLYVPVVHDANGLTLQDIAAATLEMRLSAMRGDFDARELSGANIVVALHNEADVVLAQPLVFPGHTCAVSVAGVRQVLRPDPISGGVRSGLEMNLGLAYDHRFVNGRDAVLFLKALREELESPSGQA